MTGRVFALMAFFFAVGAIVDAFIAQVTESPYGMGAAGVFAITSVTLAVISLRDR